MKRQIKPNRLIFYSIAFSVAFIAAGIILQLNTERIISKSRSASRDAIESFHLHNKLQNIVKNVILTESLVRGFVITGDSNFIAGVADTLNLLKQELASLQQASMNQYNQASFTRLASLIEKRILINNEIIDVYTRFGKAEAEKRISSKAGTILRDSITDLSMQLEKELYEQLQAGIAQNRKRTVIVLAISRLLTILGLSGIVILSMLVIRHLMRQHQLIKKLKQANDNETEARQNIERISAEIQDLYNNAPCGYHSLDGDARIIAINDTELKWLGYTRDEVVGKLYIYDILDEATARSVRENFSNFKRTGSVRERRLTMRTKSGTTFPVVLNSVAVYDSEGNYVSSRSTIFDITEQQKAETALKEARRQAIESANVKEQFLANMSHEIRTPINSVIGFTNLLQKTRLSEEQQQFVNLIQSASENLLAIINDILDISKIEAGMLRIEKNPFSIRGLCSSVETMFYHKAREKNLSFSLYIQENIPDTLNGDAVRLTQILVNLISNAIKFTQKGGIFINITALSQQDDLVRLQFSVKDSGIGIPADKLETVFERFQQGETDTTRKYGGTGLGLSIVKNLVQLQGGHIRVNSEPGKGTEFIFDIEYSLVTMGESIPPAVTERTEISSGAFPDARVLVVEDNAMNQLLIKFTFQSWKVNYELADNGTKAIEWLQRATFHLVLLDIQMPLMDGYATAQAIRKELKSDIPIIAMTAHALAGEREKCLSYGMNDYISKPIHEKELYSLLTKYLANDRNTNIEMLKNDLHYIDLDFLQDMVMGNGDFLKTIIKQFLKQFPGEMEALKNAIDHKDAQQVAALSHHIQSTVSILGKNTPFFQQLEKLEKLAKKNTAATQLSTEYDKLNDYKHLLIQEVNQLLNARVF
ncbi:hybrid sensor histidine kinase/response regulator [Longitalea luteola]|uniref:hybrid sensor histidine kinase/response regulator n=1 Tax=Longitalea luteola TaxID=2812563 RepID=UPI001A979C28|nr:ATP-binding protein [Longitalea luteola]